jgi:hypothetical protein
MDIGDFAPRVEDGLLGDASGVLARTFPAAPVRGDFLPRTSSTMRTSSSTGG